MTNQDLEQIYKDNIDEGHVFALKMIYNLGYSAGSGQPLTTAGPAPVTTQAKPAAATISSAKTVTKRN